MRFFSDNAAAVHPALFRAMAEADRASHERVMRAMGRLAVPPSAQGVALAARLTGRRATIYMPVSASLPKVEATRDYGAVVVLEGQTVDDTIAAAQAEVDRLCAHLDFAAGARVVPAGLGDAGPLVGAAAVSLRARGIDIGIA